MTKRVNRPHKKPGFPPMQPPPNAAVRIAALAAAGHNVVGIARAMNVSEGTLRRWMEESPSVADAFVQGKDAERHMLHSGLVKSAKRGNIVAAMFLLKSRHGYREGDQSDAANKVSITFALPGAVKPEDFFKVIEHEPANTALPVPAKGITRT